MKRETEVLCFKVYSEESALFASKHRCQLLLPLSEAPSSLFIFSGLCEGLHQWPVVFLWAVSRSLFFSSLFTVSFILFPLTLIFDGPCYHRILAAIYSESASCCKIHVHIELAKRWSAFWRSWWSIHEAYCWIFRSSSSVRTQLPDPEYSEELLNLPLINASKHSHCAVKHKASFFHFQGNLSKPVSHLCYASVHHWAHLQIPPICSGLSVDSGRSSWLWLALRLHNSSTLWLGRLLS